MTGHSVKNGRKPDFIIIGSMKAGTTTLYQHLTAHPQVFRCRYKEPQFFSRDNVYQRGFDWYESIFADAQDDQICGEASTCYTRWPHFGNVAERIHAYAPNVKLIYLMRHPVERAYSHYKYDMEGRFLSGEKPIISFEDALEEKSLIINASNYMMQIQQYIKYFSRDQLLLLTFDDLRDYREHVVNSTFAFIGVDPKTPLTEDISIENASGTATKLRKADMFVSRVRHSRVLSGLIDLVPKKIRLIIRQNFVESALSYAVVKSDIEDFQRQLTPLTKKTRKYLLGVFSNPTKDLECFIGKELPDWHR